MTYALRRLALPFALLAPAVAHAQLIDDVDFRRDGSDAVLQVRFVAPIQYRRALVARSGDSVQVIYDLVTRRENTHLVPSERRIVGGGAMPDFIVTDESPARDSINRKLAIRFSKSVPFKVRAGQGDRLLEIVLPGLATAIPATLQGKGGVAAPTSGYQITLQQSDSPNVQLDTPIPAALQRYQVFTAPRQVDGRTVHEVSIGYFETLVEAEAARQQLLKRFPGAALVALAPPPAPAAAAPVAPLPAAAAVAPAAAAPAAAEATPAPANAAEVAAQAAALLAAAKAADAAQDSATALDKLNVLLNLPSNASTREAQALAGDIRARTGDTVRARAEYETFLQLYPSGADADRVRAALARLPAAAPAAARVAEARPVATTEPTSTLTGSVGAFYYGGASKVLSQDILDSPIGGLPQTPDKATFDLVNDQSLLLTNVDVNWRYRDADTDMRFVFRDAYSADLKNSDKSKNRMSALYFEHRSLSAGTQVRLGRQSPTGGGVLNRYDGVQAAYTFVPKWRINVAAGVPAEKLLDSKRSFYGVWVDADALTSQLGGSLYYNKQLIDSETDRSAIGTEMRFFSGGVSANGVLDYDKAFKGINIASLQGTWQTEDHAVVNLLLDRRKTPLLALGNALFFQAPPSTATRVKELLAGSTLEALRRTVRATTSNTLQGLLGATTPIHANWQVGADIRVTDVGEIPAVTRLSFAGQGRNRNHGIGAQVIGVNLYSPRDAHIFAVSLQRGTSYALGGGTGTGYNGTLLSYNNSSQVNENLMLEPSLRLYLQSGSTGGKETRWTPGLRLTYRVIQQVTIESELNGEYGKSTTVQTDGSKLTESNARLFYYLGARCDF